MQVTLVGRVLLPIMVFFFSSAGLYQIPLLGQNAQSEAWLVHGGVFLCALFLGWLMWHFTEWDGELPTRGEYAVLGAIILGFIGFWAGFAGPIIFTPESNQGPLLGILLTGPLGCIVGAAVGYVVWTVKNEGRRP